MELCETSQNQHQEKDQEADHFSSAYIFDLCLLKLSVFPHPLTLLVFIASWALPSSESPFEFYLWY